jgi:hypothetical protein
MSLHLVYGALEITLSIEWLLAAMVMQRVLFAKRKR